MKQLEETETKKSVSNFAQVVQYPFFHSKELKLKTIEKNLSAKIWDYYVAEFEQLHNLQH